MTDRRTRVYSFSIPQPLQKIGYAAGWAILRLVMFCTIRVQICRPFPADAPGGCLLACNHSSHFDPHAISVLLTRKVDWLSRIEFFRNPVSAFILHLVSAIPVNRQGVALGAVKAAIRRVKMGRTVGICPEGEVMRGESSVLLGGKLKRGVGLIAMHTSAPVVPCCILGLAAMHSVGPWLPARRGRIWLNFGPPIHPRLDLPRREAREQLTVELEKELRRLAAELLEKYDLPAEARPDA